MKEHMHSYKDKLEKSIGEYMDMPASERTAGAVKGMVECWKEIDKLEKKCDWGKKLSVGDVMAWTKGMSNSDGTSGAHWTVEQTEKVAEAEGIDFSHIDKYEWNAAMNMVYSDYCKVAEKHGVGTAEFYADMAKAFLFDKDGGSPEYKLSAYYNCISKK